MPTWQAEVEIDEPLVRELLGQFPQLEARSVRRLSEGWDRSVWLVDDAVVFGFPRREVVIPGLQRELEFLPRLAPLLPLPIPVPVYVGRPTGSFPWPFGGSAFLPGEEAGDAGLDEAGRTEVGVQLASFLRRLHGGEVAEAIGADALPLDGNRRADMADRVPKTRQPFAELERLGLWRRSAELEQLLAQAEQLGPSTESPVLAHGDLHFRHLLVERGRLSGVIDWIDMCRSDPAIDLVAYWSFVPPSGRDAFMDAYGPVDDEQLLRARIVALSVSAHLALYGHAEGHESIAREALEGIALALSD